MIDAPRRSPANITAQAAAPMARWALVALVAAFIVPGLFGHDLWPQDAAGFGRMWSMVQGTVADWLLPNVAGSYTPQTGPLPAWLGATLILLTGRLIGDTNAAAAANLLWYALAMGALWSAVHRLARRDEAQPVAAAFGGEASRSDYARLVADICVLLTIGTIGMMWRMHQTQGDAASVAIVAVVVLATSLIDTRIWLAALVGGAATAAYALAHGPMAAAGLLAGGVAIFWRAGAHAAAAEPGAAAVGAASGDAARGPRVLAAGALFVAVALVLATAWPLAAYLLVPAQAAGFYDAWVASQPLGWPRAEDGLWVIRNGTWFFWPLWPLAAWAVYAWRSSLYAPHLERALLLFAGLFLALLFAGPLDERGAVGLLPPLVVLASFGATTLRRALDNVVDWFAIAVFSLALVFFWAYYVAMEAGAPKAMAASIARLAPGYATHPQLLQIGIAAAATLAWVQLIAWRVLRRPRVLWRGPMLAAAGVTITWMAANALFLPAVDYVFSYRSFALELSTQLKARGLGQGCVQGHRIPLAERAIISYYGKIRFDRDGSAETCRLALHHESRRSSLDNDPPPGVRGMWELGWEGHRRARPDERWRIWVRAP